MEKISHINNYIRMQFVLISNCPVFVKLRYVLRILFSLVFYYW